MIDIKYMMDNIDDLPMNVAEAWFDASQDAIQAYACSLLKDEVPAALVAELASAEWYADDMGDGEIRSVGIMSIFDAPSGKYYMPWSSNVNLLEAMVDEYWYEKLEDIIGDAGLCMTINDDTIFICEYRNVQYDDCDASEEA